MTRPVCTMLGLLLALARGGAADEIVLTDGGMRVGLSKTTGQVRHVADGKGQRLVVANEDRYDLDGKLATEADDAVIAHGGEKGLARIECINQKLGLRIAKQYSFEVGVLLKRVTYARQAADRLLLRISSHTAVEPSLFADGYYYVATDDGYKVATVPFLPGASVKEPTPWTISTGSFVYYFPRLDRTLAHYRYRVNDRFFYGEADRGIESKLVPGGAVTAIGMGFVGERDALVLETRFALIDGDAKDYHKHLLNGRPYSDYRERRVPAWFRKTRMFLSDPGAAGMTLIKDRETVARDILSFLKLIEDDEYLMVFFNHWTVQGDLPYRGTFRYFNYAENAYGEPVPVDKLKENIRWLKSFSPRIKVGGYATFTPTAGTPPYDRHKDWMVYNRDGAIEFAGDGTGLGGLPDFSSGYRDYLLDQTKHYVSDLGFDWIHIDSATFEAIDWRTRRVIQSSEVAQFYDALARQFEADNAAVVQNVSWLASLWAHGSYMECQQPDRWEKKDWRIVAVPGSLAALYRNYRPGVWSNLCYGTLGIYGVRNAQTGMKGWIRNATNWWRDAPHSLAHEKVIDELLQTRASDARVFPSWWKLQTDRLEAEALERGQSLIIPVLLHADKASDEEISLKAADARLVPGRTLFAFDFRLSAPEPLDVFRPVPWRSDYVTLTGFQTHESMGDIYRHRMRLAPLRNVYHVLTQVPAWVYTRRGRRTPLLMSETEGVRITGSLSAGASRYQVRVENEKPTAQVLAYVPQDWANADVTVNGKPTHASMVAVLKQRCVLVDVGQGTTTIELCRANDTARSAAALPYVNPYEEVWREASERLFYHNLEHRAYEEDGMSCLALREIHPGGGSADFPLVAKEKAGGFHIAMKGASSGGTLEVVLFAGDAWSYRIKDDFQGWRHFTVRKDQMTPASTRWNFAATTSMSLRAYPVGAKELHVADFHLTPAAGGDLPEAGNVTKRKLVIHKAGQSPAIDGLGKDACWKSCAVATDFYKYSAERPAEGKTEVRVCYDDQALYVLFDNLEPISSLATVRVPEAQVFLSDHAHLFLDPFRDSVRYFEIAVDTAGTVADIKNGPSGADMKWNGAYEVKTALNYNVGWTAELKIPFATLGKVPQAGDAWGITFARIDNSKEFSVWTPGEWNDPAGFGEIIFSGEAR